MCRLFISLIIAVNHLTLDAGPATSDASAFSRHEINGKVAIVDLIDNSFSLHNLHSEIKIVADTATVFCGINSLSDIGKGDFINVIYRSIDSTHHADTILFKEFLTAEESSNSKKALSLPIPATICKEK